MKKVIIERNDSEQRIDRFIKKFLDKAPKSFICKMLRKKNITLNGKKTSPEVIVKEGDSVEFFLSDETISNFQTVYEKKRTSGEVDIVYENCGILILNKPERLLSHGTGKGYEDNLLDRVISLLIREGKYNPRIEKTFSPALCNRLDRNTSGLIICAKNHQALKEMNAALKGGKVSKKYMAVVKGEFFEERSVTAFLTKDFDKNKVKVSNRRDENAKEIRTVIKPKRVERGYSELEISLLTGRTHQIRSQLGALGFPIIGDDKYGDAEENKKWRLQGQFLHCKELCFNGFDGKLSELNNLSVKAELSDYRKRILEEVWK